MEARKNYGYFDDTRREYVITDYDTPRPWMNYLGNEDFFSVISNTGGGYSFFRDAEHCRLTRYNSDDASVENGGRYFYINDDDVIWSPCWRPCKTPLDSYECRHGIGYTRIKASKDDIDLNALFFVPPGINAEIQKLTFTNNTGSVKRLQIFSFREWGQWEASECGNMFAEVEVDGPIIFNKTGYRAERDYYAFFSVNNAHIEGFDTDKEEFLGPDFDYSRPQNVKSGTAANSMAVASSSVASHCIDLRLWPGETKDLIFMLGYVENKSKDKFEKDGSLNKDKAWKMVSKYDNSSKVDKAFAELKEYWSNALESFKVKTPDEKTDRMVNIWNQYQCAVNFNVPGSASVKNILGYLHQNPELAGERLLESASRQSEDGSFEENPLWLIHCTCAYLKETGDFSILKEKVPFTSGIEMNLAEHLRLAFEFVLNHRGVHSLPADAGREAVENAGLFVLFGREYAELCARTKREEQSKAVLKEVEDMCAAVKKCGWDGQWFINTFDASGKALGSQRNDEGKIFAAPQAWCALAGIGAEQGMPAKALDSVKNFMDCQQGVVSNNPAFTRYDEDYREASAYPRGYASNGGVSCELNPLIVIAEAVNKRPADAWEHYKKITPSYIYNQKSFRIEPFVYPAIISGQDASRPGEASGSWLSSSASLFWIAVSQYLLGVRPGFDGIEFDPCIPAEWEGFEVDRKFRKGQYHIVVKNPEGKSCGVRQIVIDGKTVEGKFIEYSSGKHSVEILIG